MNGDCNCGSDCHDHGPRRILTKAEKIEELKKYGVVLKKEQAVVKEHIKELSK